MGLGPDKAERVGSIVCFKELESAEAYPVKKPPSAAWDFPGPLSMYLKAELSEHRDNDLYLVVQKRLENRSNA